VKKVQYIIYVIVAALFFVSCREDSVAEEPYGYVQFRIHKAEGSRVSAGLDHMADAAKIEVMLRYNGSVITQTLPLNATSAEAAEYGLRSEKLQLQRGEYTLLGFYLYDKLDQKLTAGIPQEPEFTVIGGGLVMKDIAVEATLRGLASFHLSKAFVESRGANAVTQNNSSAPANYQFSDIRCLDLTVRNTSTGEVTNINGIRFDASQKSDTIVWLKAGSYEISSYTSYNKNKSRLETASVSDEHYAFSIANNVETAVNVPIRLSATASYILDYLALKEIWEALDGPNWSYHGEEYKDGINWNFNKDLDLWGKQPGLTLDNNGRVTSLAIAGFGAKGVVPDAIGQLTQLVILSLGTHDEQINGNLFSVYDPANNPDRISLKNLRHDYERRHLRHDVRSAMSSILVEAVNRGDIDQPRIELDSRITLKDNSFGVLTNGIVGISRALMRCTNLQQFYIANSPIEAETFFRDIEPTSAFYAQREQLSWSNLELLTDVELYNLPKLTKLPAELFDATGLPRIQLLNIACLQAIPSAQFKSDMEMLCEGASAGELQILYAGFNNLEETPDYAHLQRLKKLSLLDWTNNRLRTLHPFGKEININTLYLDYNQISSIPVDANGYYFGYYDTETVTLSHNKLSQVPDIFNAGSSYLIDQVDLSNNEITGFENGDAYHGMNVTTVNLAANRLSSFPAPLFSSGSPISSLNLMGNNMTEFPAGAMTGPKSQFLQSLDITYNKLTELPTDFYATNVPYLYGVDVSFNSLDAFPWVVLDGTRITVIGVRAQRDAEGNRTLREWPTGIYKSPSMAALYMGGNDLRKIEDTLSPYIYILDIKDNPNISIDVSNVCYYIGTGQYQLLYDPTQDIRGCDNYIIKE